MKNATNLEKEIVKAYFSLPQDVRKDVINHFKEFFSEKNDIEEDEEIKKELEAYKLELQAEKRAKTLPVSDDTKWKKA